jgi:plasmid stabilization system protein ParE
MRVKFHPEARVDLRDGKAFYRDRSPLAAVAFAHQIELALVRIREAPHRYATGEHGTREFVLPSRFPYTIVIGFTRML